MTFKILSFFAPAPYIPRLPDEPVKKLYPRFRWSILESTFIGYALFYIARNNVPVVLNDMKESLYYTHFMIGNIMGVMSLAYGVGKLIMGSVSDRSNLRRFMPCGLLLTAGLNLIFGSLSNYSLHLLLWGLNGFVQGMGWAPCGRAMGHWFSVRERGIKFSLWNTSHNVGGGLSGVLAAWAPMHFGWRNAFVIPHW